MGKRILFLIPSFYHGGAEILVSNQIKWLSINGWQVYLALLSNKYDESLLSGTNLSSNQILVLPNLQSVLNVKGIIEACRKYKLLVAYLSEHKIDTVIANLPLAHFWCRLCKRKLPKLNSIIYHHSMQYEANPTNTIAKKLFNLVNSKLALACDSKSICISEAVKNNIEKNFVLINPIILHNAVPDLYDKIKGVIGHRDDSERITIIIPGRLHPSKGQAFFLGVFSRLLEKFGARVNLILAGGGPLEAKLRTEVADRGLQSQVEITGVINNDDLLRKIFTSTIVVIPSISEGFGIAAVEALMLGKTVIASDAGGLNEVVSDCKTGYVFKCNDEDSCYNLCLNVLQRIPSSLIAPDYLREDYQRRFSFDAHMQSFAKIVA